jgi:hypothetical protein
MERAVQAGWGRGTGTAESLRTLWAGVEPFVWGLKGSAGRGPMREAGAARPSAGSAPSLPPPFFRRPSHPLCFFCNIDQGPDSLRRCVANAYACVLMARLNLSLWLLIARRMRQAPGPCRGRLLRLQLPKRVSGAAANYFGYRGTVFGAAPPEITSARFSPIEHLLNRRGTVVFYRRQGTGTRLIFGSKVGPTGHSRRKTGVPLPEVEILKVRLPRLIWA